MVISTTSLTPPKCYSRLDGLRRHLGRRCSGANLVARSDAVAEREPLMPAAGTALLRSLPGNEAPAVSCGLIAKNVLHRRDRVVGEAFLQHRDCGRTTAFGRRRLGRRRY